MNIIDGKKLSKEILENVKKEVAALAFQPLFCDILVGDDPASAQYVRMKERTAESVGIRFHKAVFPPDITTEKLTEEIRALNAAPNMCGIIVQLPLPASVDTRVVLDAIDPVLDADCLGVQASDAFYSGGIKEGGLPTALAVMAILDSLHLDFTGKKIVVAGHGQLVGRPVAAMLGFRGFAPKVVDSQTPGKETIIKEADILISGIGKGKYITGDMIKEGAILIDAGTSESTGSIVGDVDVESVRDVASFISPVPGGVGPVTVACLLRNVLNAAKRHA